MVDGLAPNVAYLPVAALAALTAALVTLVLAVSAWKKSASPGDNLESERSSSSSGRRCSDERTDSNDSLFCNRDDEDERDSLGSDLPSHSCSRSRSDSCSDSNSNGVRHRDVKDQYGDSNIENDVTAEKKPTHEIVSPTDSEPSVFQEGESHDTREQNSPRAEMPSEQKFTPENADPSENQASDISQELETHITESAIAKIAAGLDSVLFTQLTDDHEPITSAGNANLAVTAESTLADGNNDDGSPKLNYDKYSTCRGYESHISKDKNLEDEELHTDAAFVETSHSGKTHHSDMAAGDCDPISDINNDTINGSRDSIDSRNSEEAVFCTPSDMRDLNENIQLKSSDVGIQIPKESVMVNGFETLDSDKCTDQNLFSSDTSRVKYVESIQEPITPNESQEWMTGMCFNVPEDSFESPNQCSPTLETLLTTTSSFTNENTSLGRTEINQNGDNHETDRITNDVGENTRRDAGSSEMNGCISDEFGSKDSDPAEIDLVDGSKVIRDCASGGGDDDDGDPLDRSSIKNASDTLFFRYASVQHRVRDQPTIEEADNLSMPANLRLIDNESDIDVGMSLSTKNEIEGSGEIGTNLGEGGRSSEPPNDQNNNEVVQDSSTIDQEILVEDPNTSESLQENENSNGNDILQQVKKEEEEKDGTCFCEDTEEMSTGVSEREGIDDTHVGSELISQDTEQLTVDDVSDPASDHVDDERSISHEISGATDNDGDDDDDIADPRIPHSPSSLVLLLNNSEMTETANSDNTRALLISKESDRADNIMTTLSVHSPPLQNNAGAVLDSTQKKGNADDGGGGEATNNPPSTATSASVNNKSRPFVITEGIGGGEEPAVIIIIANDDLDSACVDSSPTTSFEMHEEATQPNNRQVVMEEDAVFSCLPSPPCDVIVSAAEKSTEFASDATAVILRGEETAEQDGKATSSVQGSHRDHLIGKTDLENTYSKQSKVDEGCCYYYYEESGGGGVGDCDRSVTVSPAPRYATNECIQLSTMMSDSGRCNGHDRTTTAATAAAVAPSEGLERLDELVDLLNHLANDGADGDDRFAATHDDVSTGRVQRDAENGELQSYSEVKVLPCQQSFIAQSSSSSNNDYNELTFHQLKSEDFSSPVLDNYSVELDEVLNTTHSSYNADISNNYLVSDESTTGGYPADTSVYVSSEQHDDLTSTYENSDVLDAYTTRSSYFDHGCDSSERTELLSIDESLGSAVSPTDNEFSLVEVIGNLKHDGRNEQQQSNKQVEDNIRLAEEQQRDGVTGPSRERVLKSLKALTLKLKISGGSATPPDISAAISPSANSDHTTVSVSEFATDSSGVLAKIGDHTEDSVSSSKMFDGDSPRRQRLLRLLERDQERQLRLKELSEFRRENGHKPRASPSTENDESGDTLRALESAIGHVQDIIGRRESSFAHTFATTCDLNDNELQFTSIEDRMTIDTGRHVFRDQLDITNRHKVNRSHDDGPSQNHCMESTLVDGQLVVKNSQEINTDLDRYYYSSEISIERADADDNTEVIYDSVLSHGESATTPVNSVEDKFCQKIEIKKCEKVSSQFSDDRWQCASSADAAAAAENGMLIRRGENRSMHNRQRKREREEEEEERRELPNSRTVHEHHFGEAELHETTTKTSESGGGAEWRFSSDVTDRIIQSRSSSNGEERAPRESRSFSDDDLMQQQQPLAMENGGTDMDPAIQSPPNGSSIISPIITTTTSTTTTPSKTPTPTKIKNLRFKLDPDIYDLPSENGYEDDEYNRRPNWRKQTKYNTFSALDLGKNKEPVKVVSVRTSVVPGGQKMVVKPVCVSEGQRTTTTTNGRVVDDSRITVKHLDIDLRIRLETEDKNNQSQEFVVYDSKKDNRVNAKSSHEGQATRCYISNVSPAQNKRRSPVPDFWNQSLSPVSETCDFMPSVGDSNGTGSQSSFDSGERNVHWSPESSFRSTDVSRDESFSSLDGDNQVCTNGSADNATSYYSEDEPIPFKPCQQKDCGVKENGDSNAVPGGLFTSTPSRPSSLALNKYRKHVQLPRKKFVPDPEAIERITGYKAAEEKSVTKPPLPPVIRSLSSNRIGSGNSKTRIEQLRKRYLDSKSLMAAQRADGSSKFEEFLNRAQEDRAKLITSTPDLAAFEAAVRSQWSKARKQGENGLNGKENSPPPQGQTTQAEIAGDIDALRCETPDEVWLSYVQSLRRQLNRRSQSLSYLETDIDAFLADDKFRSTATLEPANSTQSLAVPCTKEHRIGLPIDESGRTKSEHELRIERSLQNLTVPDWYKHSQRPKTGFILDKKTEEKKGWAAVKSLTSSTSSLSSAGTKPKRPTARSLRSSRENLQWSRGSSSPASADNSYGNRWGRTHSGPVLSLAVAKAFREPYLGWRTRTPSSCASPSPQPDFSPPSWVVMDNNTDRSDTPLTSDLQAMDEEEDDNNGFSFEGEDVLETANTSSLLQQGKVKDESPTPHSADDTCEDVINISMETCDAPQMVNGHDDSKIQDLHNEDTCDDIKNITMDTFELVPPPSDEPKQLQLLLSPVGDDTSDDILNISTDTSSHMNHRQVTNEVHLNGESIIVVTESTGQEIASIHTDNNSDAFMVTYPVVNGSSNGDGGSRSGSTSPMQQDCTTSASDSQVAEPLKIKEAKERSKFDPKRKRYSYNRSIYQNELDGVVKVTKGQHQFSEYGDTIHHEEEVVGGLHQDGGSTRSLPAANDGGGKSGNNVIWIESSFVGSRTTTSIMVMPPERNHKHKTTTTGSNGCCRGGSTGSSNSSVGRPASR